MKHNYGVRLVWTFDEELMMEVGGWFVLMMFSEIYSDVYVCLWLMWLKRVVG